MNGLLRFIRSRRSAAAWFARLRGRPITPGLDTKFRRWLAADPANEVKYERQELAWELAGELANDAEITGWLAEAQNASVTTSGPQQRRRHLVTWAAAAAALSAVAVGALFYVQSTASEEHLYVTAIGEQRTVVLSDQSRIALNTSSRVRVTYTRSSRLIELERGEATFSVSHDEARPFDVVAARGRTRAIGTEFNVLTTSSGATVSVLDGTVAIAPQTRSGHAADARAVRVTRGEEVTYSNGLLSEVRPLNVNRIQAWHEGRIAFEGLPLKQAIAEFNRYTQTPIVVRDASLASLRVTGTFRIGETEALLSALNTAFGVQARRDTTAIELHAAVE